MSAEVRPIALCRRCRRAVLPKLAAPSWHRDVHRAAAARMVAKIDPKASKARRRNIKKLERIQRGLVAGIRAKLRAGGIGEAARFYLDARRAVRPVPLSDECPDCLKLQRTRSAA